MTYRFKLQEPIAEGVRRIGLEQIDIAATKLASKEDTAAAVHDARRCLKRLRAMLRLVRPGLAQSVYRREADRLIGIGRLLSGARDLYVMQQTLHKLETRFGKLSDGASVRVRKLVKDGGDGNSGRETDARRQALTQLDLARRLFTGRAPDGLEFGHAIEGLGISYRKARKAFRRAYKQPSDDSFHAWRKRVQQHWRHMALLSRGWPEAMSARASEAKELSRLLGEDHDYAVLLAFARERSAPRLEPQDVAALLALCRRCQAQLRTEAKSRGERLFAERASDLKERVKLYWTSAAELAALTPSQEPATVNGARKPASRKRSPAEAPTRSRHVRRRQSG